MTALLGAELIKLRTTRTFAAMAGASLALSLLITGLVAGFDDTVDARELLDTNVALLFIVLLGAIGITGEWRHRTITSSLLAAPDRIRFLVAKVIAYAVAGAVLAAIVTAAVALLTTGILSSRDMPTVDFSDVVDALWRNVLVAALGGGLGVAVGSIVRNQAGALLTLLVLATILEPVLIALDPDVGKFLPVNGAPNGISRIGDDEDLLSPAAAVGVELLWIAGLAAIGGLLLRRRDL